MLNISIPNFGALSFTDLVFDYNGTLAVDGRLIPGVKPRLQVISATLSLHGITADTFGLAAEALADLSRRLIATLRA